MNTSSSLFNDWETMDEEVRYNMKLYISGASPNSVRAIANLKNICENYLSVGYDLEIIDVYQQPSKATSEQVIGLPMLIKYFPLPIKRLFGDLSDTGKVLKSLGLNS
jgi:circadian clock protein KaiB